MLHYIVPSLDEITPEQIGYIKNVKSLAGYKDAAKVADRDCPGIDLSVGVCGGRGNWVGDPVLATREIARATRLMESTRRDWRSVPLLHLDIETFSDKDLKKTTVFSYVESDAHRVLLMSYAYDEGPVQRTEDPDVMRSIIIDALAEGRTIVAYNAAFERINFSKLLGKKAGDYIDPERFLDAQALVAVWGYPRALKNAAVAIGAEEKDEAGTRLINLFSKPNKDGSRNTKEDYPEEWAAFGDYCDQDVDTMRDILYRLGRDFPTETERQVFLTDQRINDRGIRIDTALADAADRCFKQNKADDTQAMKDLTGIDNPNSVKQMQEWLSSRGVHTSSLDKAHVEQLIEDGVPEDVERVLRLKQSASLSAASKFSVARDVPNSDERIRGILSYGGANTMRWASRTYNTQNAPRDHYDTEEQEAAAIAALKRGERLSTDDLKKLIRPLEVGPFTVCDYSAIEARVTAWLSGEDWALDAFRQGRDIYVETANMMGGEEVGMDRQKGKVAVLACIAEGTPILTDRGEIPIEDVTTDMKVWDGTEFVSHDGLVFKGVKDVIEYDGLVATGDHLVWVEGECWPVPFGVAARCGSRLVRSGDSCPCGSCDRGEAERVAHYRGKARVYDLANAGPLHRYTAAGRLVHNCGFSGGVNAMRNMGGASIYPKGTPDDEVNAGLQDIVDRWRSTNENIVQFWGDVERAFRTGGGIESNLVSIVKDGRDRYVWLPSGRALVYHDVSYDYYQPKDKKTGESLGRPRYVPFAVNAQTGGRRPLSVNTLTENIVQATARDLLAASLVRLEDSGYPVVAHIHDEVVVEKVYDGSVEDVSRIMCVNPGWADGLPLNAEGYTCDRYKKG